MLVVVGLDLGFELVVEMLGLPVLHEVYLIKFIIKAVKILNKGLFFNKFYMKYLEIKDETLFMVIDNQLNLVRISLSVMNILLIYYFIYVIQSYIFHSLLFYIDWLTQLLFITWLIIVFFSWYIIIYCRYIILSQCYLVLF